MERKRYLFTAALVVLLGAGCVPTLENPTAEPGDAADSVKESDQAICRNLCGNGSCEEIVCMGTGCPCAETPQSCPQDCS